ncbi:putative MFS family arabinose efflux permease [Krasilnikovia cinnamomea]|uniref:Putative MFS family arabinose efflux permease n=1 Tax=Krasilnikovia cinnamomea TaxID=349313 RepID=A0A4Q7ZJA3_9ACTN|nr:MFS transporter [Krasilnikovia cinnamomea]RZU50942.1 putative MFS family arabinose efflux permease [Krasilnikovia cinnamomea]
MRTLAHRLLPPSGPLRAYSLISLLDAVGTGVFMTGSAAYFVFYIGLRPAQVGVGLTVAGLIGLLTSVPAGMLGDRFGHRRLLVALNVVRAACFVAYMLVGSFPAFLVVVTVVALAECAEPPNRRAYLSAISTKESRVKANAYNRTVWNIGFAVGSALTGVVLAHQHRSWFAALALANAVSYVLAAVVLTRLPAVPAETRAAAAPASGGRALRDGRFMTAAGLAGVLYMNAQLVLVGVPLWVLQRTDAPRPIISVLLISNTVLVVLLQVAASKGADTARGAARMAARAGVALFCGCLLFGLTAGRSTVVAVALLLAAMAIITLGEIWCSAATWGISYELAGDERQGEYLGAWSLAVQAMQALGPVLFAAPLIHFGLLGWAVVGALFLTAGVLLIPATAWAHERRPALSTATTAESATV